MLEKISFTVSSITSFLLNLGLTYKLKDFIPEKVKEYMPSSHKRKISCFGGLSFIFSMIIALLISNSYLDSHTKYLVIYSLIPFGFIGFLDDYKKLHEPEGLKENQKLFLQILFSLFLGALIFFFKKVHIADFGLISFKIDNLFYFLIYYVIFSIIFLNAFNFVDGIDGLAGSIAIILLILLYAFSHDPIYLILIPPILAFLFFNFPPARIFMGDTGSLALGALILASFIYFSLEKALIISGIIIFLEFFSVVIQRYYYKLTKKIYGEGKRVFKMAPFHHHLEKCGIPQTKILGSFVVLTAFFSLISYFLFS